MGSKRPRVPPPSVRGTSDSTIVKVGNYRAPVDTTGLDPAMKDTMTGQRPISKTEKWLRKFLDI